MVFIFELWLFFHTYCISGIDGSVRLLVLCEYKVHVFPTGVINGIGVNFRFRRAVALVNILEVKRILPSL